MSSQPSPQPSQPTDASISLHRHVAPFRAWYARRTPQLSERYAADRWNDVVALVRFAGTRGLTDAGSWTPELVREVTWSSLGGSLSAAEEVIEAFALFLEYLGETQRWTGRADDLTACLDLLDAIHDEVSMDEPWDVWAGECEDELGDDDDEASILEQLRRQNSPEFQRALLSIDLMVARWRAEQGGRAS